jgi:hypothetical protein
MCGQLINTKDLSFVTCLLDRGSVNTCLPNDELILKIQFGKYNIFKYSKRFLKFFFHFKKKIEKKN